MAADRSPARTTPEPPPVEERQPAPRSRAAHTDAELLRCGYRFALSLTHDASRSEDLLQDAWVAVLKAGGARTPAYLITAIRTRYPRREPGRADPSR